MYGGDFVKNAEFPTEYNRTGEVGVWGCRIRRGYAVESYHLKKVADINRKLYQYVKKGIEL